MTANSYYASNIPVVYDRDYLTGANLLDTVSRTVQRVFSREGFGYFQSRWVFIATWHNVRNYGDTSQSNVSVIYLCQRGYAIDASVSVCLLFSEQAMGSLIGVRCFALGSVMRFMIMSQ